MTCARCGGAPARSCGVAGVELCDPCEELVHRAVSAIVHGPVPDLPPPPDDVPTEAG